MNMHMGESRGNVPKGKAARSLNPLHLQHQEDSFLPQHWGLHMGAVVSLWMSLMSCLGMRACCFLSALTWLLKPVQKK